MKLPQHIDADFSANKLPISDERVNKWIYGLIKDSYSDSIAGFSDDITKFDRKTIIDKQSKLIALVQKIELPFRDDLEKLCGDSVLSLFNNIDKLKLECLIVDECKSQTFNINPTTPSDVRYNSLKDVDIEGVLKTKRKYTNLITIGAAQYIADKILDTISDELIKYDENLPYLYEKILKINNYLSFVSEIEVTDRDNFQGAYETVTFGNDGNASVKSCGIIFPFLLIETIRGFIEVISTKHIGDVEGNLIEQCDVLSDEPWHYRIGETFFKRFIGKNSDIDFIPEYLDKLFTLKPEKFVGFMLNGVVNTVEFENKNTNLINKIKHNIQYKDFEKQLDAKRNEKGLITDEYYDIEDFR